MKIGVFLARFQPLHKSHQWLIEKSLEENEKTYVFIGSANRSREKRNPFDIEERKAMLRKVFNKEIMSGKLIVETLNDYTSEDDKENVKVWGEYFYKNVVEKISQEEFSLYYSDDPSIMLDWFTEDIAKKINFRFFNRNEIFSNLSATKIREALVKNDLEYLSENLPYEILEIREGLVNILNNIK